MDFGPARSRSSSGCRTRRCRAGYKITQVFHNGQTAPDVRDRGGGTRARTAASSRSRRRRATRRSGRSSPRRRRTGRGTGELDALSRRRGGVEILETAENAAEDHDAAFRLGQSSRAPRMPPAPPRPAPPRRGPRRARRCTRSGRRSRPSAPGTASASRVIASASACAPCRVEDPPPDVAPEAPGSRCPPRSSARGSGRRRRSPRPARPARGVSGRGTRPRSRGRTSRRRRRARRRPTGVPVTAPSRSPASRSMPAGLHPEPRRLHLEPELLEERAPARGEGARVVELALHRIERRQHGEDDPLRLPVAADCSIADSQRSIASSTSVGPSETEAAYAARRAALLTDVTRAAGVLDCVERRLGGVAETAGRSGFPREETPGHCESCLVVGALRRSGWSPLISSSTVSGLHPSAPVRSRTRSRMSVARAASAGAAAALPMASSRTADASSNRPVRSNASPCSGRRRRRSGWSAGRSAAARPRRFAAAGTSPRAKARLPADASRRAPSSPSARPRSSSGPSSDRYVHACSRW